MSTLPAPVVLRREALHHLVEPGRDGHASVAFDGMPPTVPGYLAFGPLRLLGTESFAADYEGFSLHPHANQEILTFMLEGAFLHSDDTGHTSRVAAGDVHVMSAGAGIRHAEHIDGPTRAVHLILDPDVRGTPPENFQRSVPPAERTRDWVVLASGRPGDPDALPLRLDAAVVTTRLEAGQHRRYRVDVGRRACLMVVDGPVAVDGTPLADQERVLLTGPCEVELSARRAADVFVVDVA